MIGYVTLGSNDIARSAAFFEPIAEILGQKRIAESERMVMWGTPGQGALLGVIKPYDEQAASVGNGSMFGLAAQNEEQVDRIHAHALAHGGSDEGAPGPRGESFYAAYFRDPDGNKLVAFLHKG